MLGQELTPGDFVVMHGDRHLSIGVFVGMSGNGYYHVQSHYVYSQDSLRVILDYYRDMSQGKRIPRLPQVSWPQRANKILKINPEGLADDSRELLECTREVLYITRKMRR